MAVNCEGMGERSFSSNERSILHQKDNTDKVSCATCESCRKFLSGNHPDFITIEPTGTVIKIAKIRDLWRSLAMKPYGMGKRVIIILDSHAMNQEAGNALLKALEEPPDNTVFILTALQTADLLPTIVSRCQHVRFNPVSRQSIETFMKERRGFDSKSAEVISAIAWSCGFTDLFYRPETELVEWTKKREWVLNEVEALGSRSIVSLLAFAGKLAEKKEMLYVTLEMIKIWLRDLIVYRYSPEKIVNRDLTDRIQYASQGADELTLISKINAVTSAQRSIDSNANTRLAVEVMIMRLAEV